MAGRRRDACPRRGRPKRQGRSPGGRRARLEGRRIDLAPDAADGGAHALVPPAQRAHRPEGRPRNCDPERRASNYEVAPRQKPEQRCMALCRWTNAGGRHIRRSDR
jgi:hypothetical protein